MEGLVAVALDAPIGKRGGKRKCKPVRDIDCTVLSADKRLVRVEYDGVMFIVGRGKFDVAPGDVVEVRFDGQWYERSGRPKFARIQRVRTDLVLH